MVKQHHLSKVGFQPGNVPHNKGIKTAPFSPTPPTRYKRLNDQQDDIADGMEARRNLTGTDCCSAVGTTMRLRKKIEEKKVFREAKSPQTKDSEDGTYRLWHPKKTLTLVNEATKQHRRLHPKCEGDLWIDEDAEVKWGLAWKERVKCDKCRYVSRTHKLYTEVESKKRGPKAATVNLGLQAGLNHTSIGNTGATKLILATNTPAPCMSGMQKSANKMKDTLIKSNENSMKKVVENIKVAGEAVGMKKAKIDLKKVTVPAMRAIP